MGMIISSYDIAATILTPLISYIGGSRKKPLFCAWGLFAMGVGFYIFMLPHFVSPPLEATGRCTRMGKFRVNKSTDFSSFILFSIFFLVLFHYFLVFLIQSTAIKGPLPSSVIRFLLSSREKLFFSDSRM